MELSKETLEKIDKLIGRYPEKRSAALMLLHVVQEEKGYISKEATEWIAQKLDLEPINIHELVTFYPMFREAPIGKKHIKVCRTLSCALNGSYTLCKKLQEELKCGLNETSEDGNYHIEFVECIASCGTAPVVQVDEKLYENITPEKAAEFAQMLRDEVGDVKDKQETLTSEAASN